MKPLYSNLKEQLAKSGVFLYLTGRAAVFTIEFETFDRLLGFLPHSQRVARKGPPELKTRLLKEILNLLKKDATLFAEGILPLSVLKPEALKNHSSRLFKLIADGRNLYRRRKKHENKSFENLSKHLDENEIKSLPDYYLRNYHFQTDGYLSDESAELYDHQVDMLFSGTTDAMRRSWIRFFFEHIGWGHNKDLRGVDIAGGSGSSIAVLRSVFPKARILGIDLSSPYIKFCAKRFRAVQPTLELITRDFRNSGLEAETFDLATCMFLFHELPKIEREKILLETHRVLKADGYAVIVDSIQKNPNENWLDPFLEDFPVNYHEPYFKDYAQTPMEGLFADAGFRVVCTERAFMSRYWILEKKSPIRDF